MALDSFKKGNATYYRLEIMCPVCRQRGKHTPPTLWYHGTDEGDMYIGDDANYECKLCGYNAFIMDWSYWCPEHSNSADDYIQVTDKAFIADVVSAAGSLVEEAGIPWLQTLLANLEKGKGSGDDRRRYGR